MTRRRGFVRPSACSDAVFALAVVLFTALSVQSQSKPAESEPSCTANFAGEPVRRDATVDSAGSAVKEVQNMSFPELANVDLRVRGFLSPSDYFRTRFSVSRLFLLMRMRYFIEVNPAVFQQQAPPDGVCAILAHELAHIVSLNHGNRVRRLGLVRLLSKRYTAKFERGTDLEAIHRGYGKGLKNYRSWVYTHIPPNKLPEKLRDYFVPEEIAAIEARLQQQPDLFACWRKQVPMNLQEIQTGSK